MRCGFSAEQRALAGAVRDVAAAHCPAKAVRAAADDPGARRGDLWRHLAGLGFFGLLVPERHGGMGLTEWDAVLCLEELGRVAAPGPLLDTALVGPPVLAAEAGLAARWLPGVAAGDMALSVASGGYLADADVADLLLLDEHGALCAAEPAEVRLTAQPGVDPARRLFSVERVGGAGLPCGAAAAADRGALGVAAVLLGLGAHLLDAAVAYAKERRQFGQPIGAFQAVKHRLADVLLALEFARPLVYRAAYTLSAGAPSAPVDVSAARAAAGEAAELAAKAALQVHGAIGYTAELDLQLWLKRVWSLRAAWGDAGWHRTRVADAVLGPPPAGHCSAGLTQASE